jgi:hypothetical protein
VCVCVWIEDSAETVYEFPLLPNNTAAKLFFSNRESCEGLTGYLSLRRRPGGDRANKQYWGKV